MAVLGYVAFALDMYGTGNVTSDRKQAGKWSGALYHDRPLLRAHAGAGLQVFSRTRPHVDGDRLAAIGYCFGGMTATVESILRVWSASTATPIRPWGKTLVESAPTSWSVTVRTTRWSAQSY